MQRKMNGKKRRETDPQGNKEGRMNEQIIKS